ncbi:MAG: PIG-L deacetylase family protein, partial [Thermoplasmata archaeon]
VTRPNVALGFPFSPNVIIDCSETMDKKIAALKCHRSQFPEDSSIDTVKTILSLYGARIGSRCAEPFKVLMPHELHVNVLAGMNPR